MTVVPLEDKRQELLEYFESRWRRLKDTFDRNERFIEIAVGFGDCLTEVKTLRSALTPTQIREIDKGILRELNTDPKPSSWLHNADGEGRTTALAIAYIERMVRTPIETLILRDHIHGSMLAITQCVNDILAEMPELRRRLMVTKDRLEVRL